MTTTRRSDPPPARLSDPAGSGSGAALAWPGSPARSLIDRAAHRRADPEWLASSWAGARVLIVHSAGGTRALVTGERAALVLLDPAEVPAHQPEDRLFLGVEADGRPLFALDAALPELPGTRAVTLREVGHLLDDRDVEVFLTAAALVNWHARHRFSSVTGRPTRAAPGGWSRLSDDGEELWPRTDPAMIVLVHDGIAGPGGRCLLGAGAAWTAEPGTRRFSCLAGFVEPGESAEAAVVREVREEVGAELSRIEYAGSQPWPFPGSLMLGFLAVADPAQPLRVDDAEIAQARWFTRAEVATALAGGAVDVGDGARLVLPSQASIARALVHHWFSG